MEMDPVGRFLEEKGCRTEAVLKAVLGAWRGVPERLSEAMAYSLFAGGKRFRPALALGAAELVSGSDASAMPAACALEMIHTYSLIHDDLPAMDDDDLRRGRPTLHKAFDEATAILAGDALLTMAFDVAAEGGNMQVVREIARAAGAAGMVGGQQLDMDGATRAIDLEMLRRIHRAKTGALIRVSLRAGALLAGAKEPALIALTNYGEQLGLAFQITDDILDVTGSEAALGKPIGSDADNEKATYPALVGLEEARRLSEAAADAAVDALKDFGGEADTFRALAKFVVERQH
jgi:geranylgeranyl diphosphate synthase, type II